MQKNGEIYDSIDDIIGILNNVKKNHRETSPKDQENLKNSQEKIIFEEQYDSLSEFQINYEEENKKKKENIMSFPPNSTNENFFKNLNPNESFTSTQHNKYT